MRSPPRRPHRVAVLALDSVVPFDLGVACQVFGGAAARGYYQVIVCGPERGRGANRRVRQVRSDAGFTITPKYGISELRRAQTVVVPGIADVRTPVAENVSTALWRIQARGGRILSICTGAFVLAAAGLLDGKRATTHWAYADLLGTLFPRVRTVPDVLYIDEGRVWTSAGMAAGIDLCLHVVRSDYGAEVANRVARGMVVAPHRSGGQAQYAERPVVSEPGGRLERTRGWMLAHLADAITVETMAANARMTRRTFVRHFRAETGTSPLRWMIHQRVLHARQLLETTRERVERVASRCGFSSALALRPHFRRATGVSPFAYRRVYQGI